MAYQCYSQPIKILNNFENNYFDNIYYFKLILKDLNKTFNKIETNKCCALITREDQIKFSDINKFKIIIKNKDSKFILEDEIPNDSLFYVKNNENIFIEFNQDRNGFVNCICYFLTKDINMLSISPIKNYNKNI